MGKKDKYEVIKDYEDRLGINHENITRWKLAFEKAWELRSFEIDKFWHRSAYFWGFIAFIFGGYVYCITGESSSIAKAMYFDLYMILLGGIFSVAWLLVICGSIQWQNNWEAHIDELEDEITGPLYKTVYYKKKCYYSVSRINKTLACVVIAVWLVLLIRYIYDNCKMFKNIFTCLSPFKEYVFVMLPIIVAIGFIIHLFFCCKTANGKIKADKADLKGKPGVFLKRVSGE